jgi:large subunit ribosomal protein L6
MSRLAKKALKIPDGVKVTVHSGELLVEGKLGKVAQNYLTNYVDIVSDGKEVLVNRKGDEKQFKACQGLYWRLTRNLLVGVSEGFAKVLNIQGL